MNKYIALFKAEIYNSFDDRKEIEYGSTECDSFAEAMSKIEENYREELIACHIELLNYSILTFDKECYDKIREILC